MAKKYVQTVGYGGPVPLAIIFWYAGDQAKCKTICYDEQDVMEMYQRHTTPGDFYSMLRPSIQLVGEPQCVQQIA